ncbi:hypothetical protein QO002_005390 [Pararhizobium capsulatum DSM 1112]|uniref:Uncharacterized protein n=1 Tax=Pararhizobium capsulatum DSM 1112 TaxID=1121113 RepID=A0ABU0BZQ0_9HYPH|nr:hypothetical protein [Pararhizobium capsulatum DSM 1112]
MLCDVGRKNAVESRIFHLVGVPDDWPNQQM